MLLEQIARTSEAVAGTRARLEKIASLASCLRLLQEAEIPIAVAYLSGELPRGAIGLGWASLRDLPPAAAPPPALDLLETDDALREIGATAGAGSQLSRRRKLADLFARATEPERRFLFGLLTGELRQGALEGVMVEAVARAASVPAPEVRRALMLSGDLGEVAVAALCEGSSGLGRFRLTLLRPVQPMLAQTATSLAEAMERVRPAAVEWKLDGIRVQVHRLGDEVRAFTRNLGDVSARMPEVLESVRRLDLAAAVLDGEAIAIAPDGEPHLFQTTMSRVGSGLEAADRSPVRLSAFFFDCLHLEGEDLLERPERERFAALAGHLPGSMLVPRIETGDPEDAERFLERALELGHEGVMVKDAGAPYEAGRRGATWLKVKRAHTLDLVVLAAEWGHGRRRGWLSNLHLGARDPASGAYVMLGKTFKGMTDQMLEWQTQRLLELETGRDRHIVHVRPELVLEVAFDGVQRSTRYPGGVALRFARVKRYRSDKRPEEADTIDAVTRLLPATG